MGRCLRLEKLNPDLVVHALGKIMKVQYKPLPESYTKEIKKIAPINS